MTTTTLAPSAEAKRRRAGYSLIEVAMVAALTGMVVIGVMGTFVFIARSSIASANYSDMERETRNAVETFAKDVRMASGVVWNSSSSVTLSVPMLSRTESVTYAYYASASGRIPAKTLVRTVNGASEVLVSGISTFEYTAYDILANHISLDAIDASTHRNTKQIQISLKIERKSANVALTTDQVISARFVLRNKKVTA